MSTPSTPQPPSLSLPLSTYASAHLSSFGHGALEVTELQVFLPSHSNSFCLNVLAPVNFTVEDVKRVVEEQCPGTPKVSGQRIIWKGRVVGDEEVVGDIWKATEGPHTIHLAVHPSSWTSAPPRSPRREASPLPSPDTATSLPLPSIDQPSSIPSIQVTEPDLTLPPSQPPVAFPPITPLPLLRFPTLPTGISPHLPPLYIRHLHQNALHVLLGYPPVPWEGADILTMARIMTKKVLEENRMGWSSAFEEGESLGSRDPNAVEDGVTYDQIIKDGLPYLSLITPGATPSPTQKMALNILTYTFPLLPYLPYLSFPTPTSTPANVSAATAHLIQQLQQIQHQGAGAGAGGAGPRVERQVLFQLDITIFLNSIIPLFLIFARAGFFVFFFPPAQKPIWIACIAAWVSWEIYSLFKRLGTRDAAARNRRAGQARGGVGAGAGAGVAEQRVPQPQDIVQGPQPQAQQPAPRNDTQRTQLNNLGTFAQRLAYINLEEEGIALGIPFDQPTPNPRVPVIPGENEVNSVSLAKKVSTAVVLFVVSLIPALWSRRSAKVREREREIRRIYADRVDDESHQGGPDEGRRRREGLRGWRKKYVDRVLRGDIPEEGDL